MLPPTPSSRLLRRACLAGTLACASLSGVARAQQPDVTPPAVVERVEPERPAGHDEGVEVVLIVVVDADGTVSSVEVDESAGDAWDRAAMDAVRQWRFTPAQDGGEAIASRIRVPVTVAAAPVDLTALDVGGDAPDAPSPAPAPAAPAKPAPVTVDVHGHRQPRSTERGPSSFELDRRVLAAAPSQEGSDVLKRAPGLFIARGAGIATGHRYMLRGFDADHGQDLELRLGGLPINLPSHIHGQGYADLSMIIGEGVDRLRVQEGVYDPSQGDFAIAGTIDVDLGVTDRGWRLKSGYGAFNTFRQLALWAPEGQSRETFAAVQYQRSDGYGDNRNGQQASAIAQVRFGEGGAWSYRALGVFHGARGAFPGVVRRDDVQEGQVDFYGVYPYPTAERQSALDLRGMVGLFADYEGAAGDNGQVAVFLGYDNFRIQQNFTGFIEESRVLDGVAGRGDLIEQQNRTTTLGLKGRYRTRDYEPIDWAHGTVELGTSARLDAIEQSQNLLDAAVNNQTWDQRVDAGIRGMDVGLWGDLDWLIGHVVRARLGLRGDLLLYDVEDRLGNFAPDIRPDVILGFRRSAFGFAAGPRASLEALPLHWLSLKAAYGEGYRSPQARTLEDGESAPFTKVRSGDVGATFQWYDEMKLTVAGFYTHLSDDVAFEAREGRLERVGASRRLGITAYAESRPTDWLVSALSITYVDAELLEPPPPTAEDPSPPFEEGQNLPFVPPVVARIDIGAEHALVDDLGGEALTGRLGSGLSFIGPRPLPFGGSARPVSLLDAGAAMGWGPFTLSFDAFNLLDVEYAAVELNYPSDWNPTGPRSRVPARHVMAGPPLSWMTTLEVAI